MTLLKSSKLTDPPARIRTQLRVYWVHVNGVTSSVVAATGAEARRLVAKAAGVRYCDTSLFAHARSEMAFKRARKDGSA